MTYHHYSPKAHLIKGIPGIVCDKSALTKEQWLRTSAFVNSISAILFYSRRTKNAASQGLALEWRCSSAGWLKPLLCACALWRKEWKEARHVLIALRLLIGGATLRTLAASKARRVQRLSLFELLLFIPQSWLMRLWVSILLLDYDLVGLILSLLFGASFFHC